MRNRSKHVIGGPPHQGEVVETGREAVARLLTEHGERNLLFWLEQSLLEAADLLSPLDARSERERLKDICEYLRLAAHASAASRLTQEQS